MTCCGRINAPFGLQVHNGTPVSMCAATSSAACPVIRSLRLGAQVRGETEVKAQIKLRFRSKTGSPVVVIRSFQVGSLLC